MKEKRMSFGQWLFYIFLPFFPLALFWFIPLILSFFISLTDSDFISANYSFQGLSNYTYILSDKAFYNALKHTLLFGLGTVIPTLALGFFLALLLERQRRGKAVFQAMIFAPWITPMVAMSIVWSWMYRPEGLINYILGFFGIDAVAWLTSSDYALWAVVIVTIWKNAGWAMVFYANALSKIPKSHLEVAYLEGAGPWQRIRHIIFPSLAPTTIFLAIVSLIESIQAYDQINVLTQGGPAGSSRTLLYLYYEMAFKQFNMGKASALSILIVIITAILAGLMALLRNIQSKAVMS